jgi:tungstate transport system permease protein
MRVIFLNPFIEGVLEAFRLIFSGDPEVLGITLLSLRVSGTAVLLGALASIPLGTLIGLKNFFGKKALTIVINTLMGLPPVVVGLVVYLLLSASGPLGPFDLLYTPEAMIIAQLVMVIPILIGVTMSAVGNVEKAIKDTAISLGAKGHQLILTILREARIGIMTAIIVAFGAAISEVGAIMIVGGNIRYYTRTLTTAIVLATRMGEFGLGIALGIILLFLAFAINIVLTYLQQRGVKR